MDNIASGYICGKEKGRRGGREGGREGGKESTHNIVFVARAKHNDFIVEEPYFKNVQGLDYY